MDLAQIGSFRGWSFTSLWEALKKARGKLKKEISINTLEIFISAATILRLKKKNPLNTEADEYLYLIVEAFLLADTPDKIGILFPNLVQVVELWVQCWKTERKHSYHMLVLNLRKCITAELKHR